MQVPYAERNNIGEIVSLHQFPRDEDNEYLEPSDPEVISFLQVSQEAPQNGLEEHDLIQALVSSDNELARVTEDLVSLLVDKKVILFSELPTPVQRKLSEREKLRNVLSKGIEDFVDDDFRII